MFVQLLVIGFRNEQVIVIEKVDLLFVAHADIGMFVQKIMQRRSAGFLRTSDYEIEPLNFATVGAKHCLVPVIVLALLLAVEGRLRS